MWRQAGIALQSNILSQLCCSAFCMEGKISTDIPEPQRHLVKYTLRQRTTDILDDHKIMQH